MKSSKASNTEELKTDIVSIGGGGAGLAAAIAAREKGANVILLEKRHRPGGNSTMAEGIFGAESPAQKRVGIDAQRDVLFKKAMDYSHWKINGRLVRVLVDKSADTIQWLEDMGLRFDRFYPMFPGQAPVTFHLCGPRFAGPLIVKALVKNAEDLGVQILCKCPAKKILTDDKGNVTGVLAATKDKEIRINARGAIIATGGFAGNKELLKKHYSSYSENLHSRGLPFTGDGLLMAMEIGAATEGLGPLELGGPHFPWSSRLDIVARDASTVWVNKNGERFTDEGITYQFPESGNALDRQPDRISFALFNVEIKESIVEEGLRTGGIGFWGFLKTKVTMPELENELQIHAGKGTIKIADSWDEIARWMGAAPEVLKATIDEYNSFCDRGHDDIFVKDQRYLVPLRTPPYYAIKCYPAFMNTLGGIKINHHMEALNQQDNPIRGLYAAGVDTGGWESETYDVALTGHSIGFAISSGRIAGENAAKYILGK